MNRTLIILSAVLLIAGAVAITIIKSRGGDEPSVAGGDGAGESPRAERAVPATDGRGERSRRAEAEDPSIVTREARLIETYGKVRTAQARQVSENVVSLLDDVVAVGEMMLEGTGENFGGRRAMVQGMSRRIGLELTEDQQNQAVELFKEWQQSELDKSKGAVERLRRDPSVLMELFLAGDAKERGEMAPEDYAKVRDDVGVHLADVVNPLDRNNFRGDRMTKDQELMNRFADTLDEVQTETFNAYREEQAAADLLKTPRDGNITAIPTMELDTLDEAVGGAKKMTAGFRSVVEGMGSLRELQPKIDPEGGGE